VAHAKAKSANPDRLIRVLVVDDESDIRELLDLTLNRMGLVADCAETVAQAREFLSQHNYLLCLTDMRLPDGDGLEIVRFIAEQRPQLPVAVITAFGSTENAVAALKAGAFDYLAKPLALDQLRTLIKSVLSVPLEKEEVGKQGAELLGVSQSIVQVRETIDKLARSQAPVYISGESGSGKELAARLIHLKSLRHAAAFVPVNCGAIPENLMESEFFGYRKGSFTGADRDHDGFFQVAHGGTLFLDEVADLPLAMQVKLLRVIQEKRVRKVGNATEDPIDVRIICATHRNLKECVEKGAFRQDLYYRINVIELRMPPLRERPEDVPLLAAVALERLGGPDAPKLSAEAETALCSYPFPGNVRELENILERAIALSGGGKIGAGDLQIGSPYETEAGNDFAGRGEETLDELLNRIERQAIADALARTKGNRTTAARLLGVSFRSLRYRIERLGMGTDEE